VLSTSVLQKSNSSSHTEENAGTLETEVTQSEKEQQDIDSDNTENQSWPIVLAVSIGVVVCVIAAGLIWKLKIKKNK
jgi:hypothetical protein